MQGFRQYSFVVFLTVVASSLPAQISIGRTHMPKAGDSMRYSTDLPANLPAGWATKTGANQSWDFSGLQSQSQSLTEFKSSLQTPYAFYFFGQIGTKTADSLGAGPIKFQNIYSFYSVSNSAFRAEGIGYSFSGFPLAANYEDEDEIYQFPLEYGDKDTSTFRFVFEVPGNAFRLVQQGVRINEVLGYGSLVLPKYSTANALMVKTTILEVDTLTTQLGQIPIPRNQTSYKWLVTEVRLPVLEIGAAAGQGGPPQAGQVRFYNPVNAGSENFNSTAKFKVYPNPTEGIVQVSLGQLPITLWDLNGRQLAEWPAGTQTLDLSVFLPGVYRLQMGIHTELINRF
ncbi:MAG: T9SS type A sorting domain-containing protein [Bacteroidia bacterium]